MVGQYDARQIRGEISGPLWCAASSPITITSAPSATVRTEDRQAPVSSGHQQGVDDRRIGDGSLAEAFYPHRHIGSHERTDVCAEEEAMVREAGAHGRARRASNNVPA